MGIDWNGKRRWLAGLLLLLIILVGIITPPVLPVIQLPGEHYPEGWDLPIIGRVTNTFAGSVLVWILLILLALYIRRAKPKDGNVVPPGGFYSFFELLFEALYGFIEGIAGGPHIRVIFNMFMTIFLMVLLSNWWELVPGVDSIGFIEPHLEEVYDEATGAVHEVPLDGFEIYPAIVGWGLNPACPWVGPEAERDADATAIEDAESAAEQAMINAREAIAVAEFNGDSVDELLSPDEAAETARQEVLDAREAEKQARSDAGCRTGIGVLEEEHQDTAGEETAATESAGGETEAEGSEEGEPVAEDSGEPVAEGEEDESVHHPTPGTPEDIEVPWVVLPFFRAPSTDLSMTVSLALVAVIMVQYLGFKSLGPGYLWKFFNVKRIFSSGWGGMDIIVGLLELIGEFAKILSFAFRLLGNIFAGSILIFVISWLVPFLGWSVFILEFAVGMIQALIFGLLTAIFMNMATLAHHDDEEH